MPVSWHALSPSHLRCCGFIFEEAGLIDPEIEEGYIHLAALCDSSTPITPHFPLRGSEVRISFAVAVEMRCAADMPHPCNEIIFKSVT